MKRCFTLVLVALLLVFSLTACGRNNGNGNNQNGNSTTAGDNAAGNNGATAPGTNNGGTNSGATDNNNGAANTGTVNNGTNQGTNDGLLNDTGDVLEDIGNGAGRALQDTGRALTGNNGTTNRSTANGTY